MTPLQWGRERAGWNTHPLLMTSLPSFPWLTAVSDSSPLKINGPFLWTFHIWHQQNLKFLDPVTLQSACPSRWPPPQTSHLGLLCDVIRGSLGLFQSLEDWKVGGANLSTPQILLFGWPFCPSHFSGSTIVNKNHRKSRGKYVNKNQGKSLEGNAYTEG